MAAADRDRELDIVLFGATGFTGGLVAHYLARHAHPECRWALAGRNKDKLQQVRGRLATLQGGRAGVDDLPLLHADTASQGSIREVAERARVVVSTVGPYLQHGEPLVAACAELGTDYADLSGEPEFVDRMYLRHHRRAVESGARLVHCCGFDSVPHDLGALFTVRQLPPGVPIRLRGMLRAGGAISGGTFHSAVGAFARARQMRAAAAARRAAEPQLDGRRVRTIADRPHFDHGFGYWLVPLPTIDPLVVRRSAAALADYGPDFAYSHYAGVRKLPVAAGGLAAAGAVFAAAQVPPLRRLMLDRVPPGHGPSPERRAKSWFTMRFVGEGGGVTVRTQVSGGDPGYDETAKMLSEAAMCLAFDDNPPTAGQVTTAQAMGRHLTDRLRAAGIRFAVC